MDDNFVRNVCACLETLRNNDDHSEERTLTAPQIWQHLQSVHPQYRRCRNAPYINTIKTIQIIYGHQNDKHTATQRKAAQPSSTLSSQTKQRKRQATPLRVLKYDQLTSYFACDCSFLPDAMECLSEYFEESKPINDTAFLSRQKIQPILISGSPGSGKHCLVKWFCRVNEVDLVRIDPGLDLEDHFSEILDMLCRRVVLLVEDVDEYLVQRHSYSRNTKVLSLFKKLLYELQCSSNENQSISSNVKARIICLCKDTSCLDESIRTMVDLEIKVPVPCQKCRLAIFKHILPSYTHDWIENLIPYTSSYLPCHLLRLADSAYRQMGKRLPQQNGQLELRDFENALLCGGTAHNSGNFLTSQCVNAVQVPETSWEDVGALDEVKKILERQIILQCKSLPLLKSTTTGSSGIGSLLKPSGILLVGPPGCGKTLIGKAIANELSLNFLAVNGPELLSMYVGESERSVRKLFLDASNFSPCLIFFDEIDALCTRRRDGSSSGHDGPLVLQQLLAEMDGIRGRSGVFLMAATNVLDVIDPAITRPGRFGTLVYIGPPECSGRRDILKRLLRNNKNVSNDCVDRIAEQTSNYTGADLEDLLRIAALRAIERCTLSSIHESSVLAVNMEDEDVFFGFDHSNSSLTEDQVKMYEASQRHRCCNRIPLNSTQ